MQRKYFKLAALGAIIALLATFISLSGSASAQTGSVYFPQTGHSLRGGFLTYWQQHGALAQQGYPITDEYPEVNSVDGRTYTTQYFERARFEFHPEQANPTYQVLLGLLGREVMQIKYPNGLPAISPVVVPGGGSYTFPQTGHTVTGLFLTYWEQHGGLAQQGYPLTEAFYEVSEQTGLPYITQYFERARFEYHPEVGDPNYRVLLGLLGDEIYARKHNGGPSPTPVPPTSTPTLRQVTQVGGRIVSIAAASNGQASVACPANAVVIGGGWNGDADLDIYRSSMNGNGWLISAHNRATSAETLTAYAMCLSGVDTTVVHATQASSSISLGSGVTDRVFVNCSGGTLTGGGFAKDLGISLTDEFPTRGGWLVYGTNNLPSGANLTTYAVCLQGVNASSSFVSADTTVKPHGKGSAFVSCPDNSQTSGGGFGNDGGMLVYASFQTNNGWQAGGASVVGTNQQLTSYAVCTTFQ